MIRTSFLALMLLGTVLLALPEQESIICLTDSTGYRKTAVFMDNEGWPYRIGGTVTHLGVCGGEVSHVFMTYHAKYGNRVHFDTAVIRLGGNDLGNELVTRDYKPERSNALFEKFITDLYANGVKRIIIVKYERLNPWPEMLAMQEAQKAIAEKHGCAYVDAKLLVTDFDKGDDVHPNESGMIKIAEAICIAKSKS